MAGGPPPKALGTRARRNKTSTNAILRAPEDGEIVDVPKLPPHYSGHWHEMTLRWWIDVWRSPMRTEYVDADKHGLVALAMVVNDFWTATRARDRQAASAEIRLQGVRYGLSPIDRRRLQWEVEKTKDAQARGAKRERPADSPTAPAGVEAAKREDPRAGLYAVQ